MLSFTDKIGEIQGISYSLNGNIPEHFLNNFHCVYLFTVNHSKTLESNKLVGSS